MRWTQLRAVLEREFAPEIAGRLAIHATGYGFSSWGRSWMTFNGAEFVRFSDDGAWAPGWKRVSPIVPGFERSAHLLVEVGEFSGSEFKRACYRFKDLKVTDAIASGERLLVALACAHRKAGVRTLRRLGLYRRSASASRSHPAAASACAYGIDGLLVALLRSSGSALRDEWYHSWYRKHAHGWTYETKSPAN